MAPKATTETARKIGAELSKARDHAAELERNTKAMMDTAVSEETLTTEDFKAKYFEARKALGDAKDSVDSLEQMFADACSDAEASGASTGGLRAAGASHPVRRKVTAGSRFVDGDVYQALADSGRLANGSIGGETPLFEILGRDEVVRAMAGDDTPGPIDGDAEVLVLPDIRPDIVGLPQLPLNILQLVSVTATTSDLVRFHVEKLFTNSAASIAAQGDYPLTDIKFDDVDMKVHKIGHIATTTWEKTQDAPRLVAWIDGRMVYGAMAELQRQIIAGDGDGENLLGMYNWADRLYYERGTDESLSDGILKAAIAIEIASCGSIVATAVGLNSLDYQDEIIQRVATSGLYLYGGPLAPLPRTMWGLNVVRHASFTQGQPMVADFSQWEVAVREGVNLTMSDQTGDNFTKDLVTYKARLRAAAGTERSYAFCTVDAHGSHAGH